MSASLGVDHTTDGCGWVEVLPQGLLLHIRGRTGWQETAAEERHVQQALGHTSAIIRADSPWQTA